MALKDLIIRLKIKPKNNKIITEWYDDEDEREKHSDARRQDGVPWTLKKVRFLDLIVIIIVLIFYRFGILLSISMPVHSAETVGGNYRKPANARFF